MSTQSRMVYTLHCDGPRCEDGEPYENAWGEVYFEDEGDARSHAADIGWRSYEDRDWCKHCKVDPHPFKGDQKQVCKVCGVHLSEHDNPDNIPVILPGQISLLDAVSGE